MDIFLQYFLAPISAGIIIFFAQFFLIPKIERNKVAAAELWKEKKDVFIKSVELIDQKYKTLDFRKNTNSKPTEFKNLSEVNRVYTRLLILTDDQNIPETFWKFFDNKRNNFTPVERGTFILQLQKELGLKNKTSPDNIPYFYERQT